MAYGSRYPRWLPRHIAARTPWGDLERLRSHLEGLYETVSDSMEKIVGGGSGVYPPVILSEDEENLYLTAEIPGADAGDLDLSLQADSLTLKGKIKPPEVEQGVNYHRRERESGVFNRVLTLPVKVEAEKVKASVVNGVLSVTMPKLVENKAQKIQIHSD